MHQEQVLLSQMKFARPWQLKEDGQSSRLVNHMIQRKGEYTLPLLTPDYRIVDGRRELLILRDWGMDQATVLISDNLEDSVQVLHDRHHTPNVPDGVALPITPRRIYQIHHALQGQIAQRHAKGVREAGLARGRGEAYPRATKGARELLIQALGLSSEGQMSRTLSFFRQLERTPEGEERDLLLTLLEQLDNREITIFQVDHAVKKYQGQRELRLRTGGVAEQAKSLTEALSMMKGIALSLDDLCHLSDGHNPANLATWRGDIEPVISTLKALSNAMKRKLS